MTISVVKQYTTNKLQRKAHLNGLPAIYPKSVKEITTIFDGMSRNRENAKLRTQSVEECRQKAGLLTQCSLDAGDIQPYSYPQKITLFFSLYQ